MLTPENIFEKDFKRVVRGYDIDAVNEFLDEIIRDYSIILEENKALKQEVQKNKSLGNRQGYTTSQSDKYTLEDLIRRVEALEKQRNF